MTLRSTDFCCAAACALVVAGRLQAKSRRVPPKLPRRKPAAEARNPATPSAPLRRSRSGAGGQLTRRPGSSPPLGPIEFTDVTAKAGIHFKHNTGAFGKKYLPETMGSGVCFLDYDNDGWQDILLINSTDWPGHESGKSFSALYHNNQDGTFTDVTRQAGLAIEMYGIGCAVGDYDNDGKDDIYITASVQIICFTISATASSRM